MTCRHCRSRLNTDGRCPGDTPLTRDRFGTAAQIAHTLGPDITAARIRDWARRSRNPNDPLHGRVTTWHTPGRARGTTWYDLQELSTVERDTRLTVEDRGGPARGQQGELTQAA
ncbi:hypothetical protein [Salinispora tropica]|nr:hypothetical protein [Salinispora tropica]